MHSEFEKICDALDNLAGIIISSHPNQNDALFSDQWGWPAPAINRFDAAAPAHNLADDLRDANPETVPQSVANYVSSAVRRIQTLQTNTVPQFYAGNIGQAFPAYLATIRDMHDTLLPALGWTVLPDKAALPVAIARRAAAAQRRVADLEGAVPELEKKVAEINAAHAVAENLEVDLQALAEAREKVEKSATETAVQGEKVRLALEQSSTDLAEMKRQAETAEKLIALCEAAYQITTTKGLAGAFDQRAGSLAWSMRSWVAGLAAALIAGSVIGASRLAVLAEMLGHEDLKWPAIISQIVLSVLGVGAPLWFSWLATKQIGQRFRLSEDYAFKASVAKAYEGYRKEAAQIDPDFQSALFRSALTRLDEAPLRLVEAQQHGTPLQEMLNSDAVKEAIRLAPDLPAKMMVLVSDTISKAKSASVEAAKVLDAAKSVAPQSTPPRDD